MFSFQGVSLCPKPEPKAQAKGTAGAERQRSGAVVATVTRGSETGEGNMQEG